MLVRSGFINTNQYKLVEIRDRQTNRIAHTQTLHRNAEIGELFN